MTAAANAGATDEWDEEGMEKREGEKRGSV